MINSCYLKPSIMGRWILANARNPLEAWSGARWVRVHANGMPADGIQVSNFETRAQATEYARANHIFVNVKGFHVCPEYITCFTCGLTSYNVNDVRERYCGNCHVFHEIEIPLEGTVN